MTTSMEKLMPKDAPPRGECVRIERPEDGLAVLVLDPPHRKIAILDMALFRDLDERLDELLADTSLRGVVVTGRDPLSFAAGADLDALARIEDAAEARELARYGQGVFAKIAALRARTVAAVGGPVPGGAYELCLACDLIVLADDKKTRVGLPETQLGILPGWGGSQRLPRRIGVPAALDAILTGRLYDARRARRSGMVDRVTWPKYLMRVATDLALGRERLERKKRGVSLWLVDKNPIAQKLIEKKAQDALMEKTGGHYPAPLRALELVVRAPSVPIEQGLEQEAEALGTLAVTPICKNLVRIFRLSEAAKKLGKLEDGSPARELERAGVIGGGVMGGGIASLLALRGLDVRLADIAREPLDKALATHQQDVLKRKKRRRLQPHEADLAIDRLTAGQGLAGFARADIAIEAVAEKLPIKVSVFSELAAQMADDAILATNTSSLSVDAIAAELPHPERVVGMHFFNPVNRMPLVEVVRGEKTSEEVVRATAKLALQLGKTPVVVRDAPGFVVNRLLGPYLDESARLFEAGIGAERLDRVAKEFGMPMGPLELIDEVGFDIATHAAHSLADAFGVRMSTSALLEKLLEEGLVGKKGGRGFYLHPKSRKAKKTPNPYLSSHQAPTPPELSDAAALDHLLLAMLNEAAWALDEHIVETPGELDLATVFGMGFAPFRGGLLRWADTLGAKELVERLQRLTTSPLVAARENGAARFEPAPLLARMAESGERFYAPD